MKTRFLNPLHCLPLLVVSLLLTAQAEPPVKVYILAGQSNMQGKGAVEGDGGNSLRSLVKNDSKKELQSLVDDKGEWVEHDNVWVHYDLAPFQGLRHGFLKPGFGSSSGQIGPEFGFGLSMEDTNEGKVLLIKAAWGGKSLGHNFMPPSVGKYPKPKGPNDPGYFYHRTLDLVGEVTENIETLFPDYKGQGLEVAGFGWHQGWNDQYGGLDAKYEANMAAFIKDIRSAEHGLGVPDLPFVIATSGNIAGESVIKQSQLAMADTKKYPEFVGNVSVVDTDKPYGSNKMGFKFDKNGKPAEKVGYHWDSNSRAYLNIGRAMAKEMEKLNKPKAPSRLVAHASAKGVVLNWQLGSEKPKSVEILRDGKKLDAKLTPTQTVFTDTSALPGTNSYELILDMPSGKVKFKASCDSSVTELTGYRSLQGVMLSWKARGNYDAFSILRDGKVIADAVPADARSYEDKTAPAKGKFGYAIQPTTGKVTPAELMVNLGPVDAGGALVYEPFDYPTDAEEPQSPLGKSGALGTTGEYVTLDEKPKHLPKIIAGGLSHGALPVSGNCIQNHKWTKGFAIDLDDGISQAGLLEDGATMWISFLFHIHGKGAGTQISLQSADGKEGIGFAHKGTTNSFVIEDGTQKDRLFVKGVMADTTYLFVAKMVWGKDGEPDQWLPYFVPEDLKLPEKPGRVFTEPFNIDQSKLSRLMLEGGEASNVDEIRVGPTFESVTGGASK
ncbi:MAG: sialate O-acetylesterase [Akkermansiaceae bacterium]